MTFILISPIIALLIGAASEMMVAGKKYLQFCIAGIVSLASVLFSSIILGHVLLHRIIVMEVGGWEMPFGIILVSDRLSAVILLITNLIGFLCILFSYFDIDENRIRHGFYPMILALLAGANGVLLTGDLFNLYVWFEVLLISAFGLLTLGNERAQLKGALPYVFINLFASTLLLLAIGALYGITGSLNMAELSYQLSQMQGSGLSLAISLLFLLALGIKAAIFPLFFWLPVSYHTPPVTVTALFSAILTKVSVYALIRLFTLFFYQEMEELKNIMLVVASLTMVIGVLGAAGQNDFRKILSFHIISQIGYMVMGLALFTAYSLAGATFFIAHNMLVKTSLFLISGISEKIFGSSILEQQGGLFRSHQTLAFFFLLSAFSLTGLPPLTGFWGKMILAQAGIREGELIVVAISLFVSLLTLFSMTKIWVYSFWDGESHSDQGLGLAAYPVYIMCLLAFVPALFPGPILEYFIVIGEELILPDFYIKSIRGGK